MPSIDILANTRAAQTNVKDLSKALDGVSDSLDGVAKDGAASGDKLEASFRDMVAGAKKADAAIDNIGASGSVGIGKVKAGAQELSQEMGQNLGEAVSSVRGNLSDLGQVGQDTLGGLAGTLAGTGPAGLVGAAALAAGAVGLGLVTASLQEQQKEADALKTRLSDAYKNAVESGQAYIDQATVVANWTDLIFNPDRAEEYKKVQETIKTTGLDSSTVMKASAGDLDALAIVQRRTNDLWKEHGDEVNLFTDGLSPMTQQIRDYWATAAGSAQTYSDKSKTAIQDATGYWNNQISTYGDVGVALDDVGNKVITLPTGKEIFIDAKTGQATDDVSRFKGDVDGTIDHLNGRDVVLRAKLDDSEIRNYRPPIVRVDAQLSVPRGMTAMN